MYKTVYLEELKKIVLQKAGISHVTPADCRHLSALILKKTGKYISETTLKRLFGFADVKHNFSMFTITALCEYAGIESFDNFSHELDSNTHPANSWDNFKNAAAKVSDFTLRTIRNRSGIPYDLTVGRKFSELDLEYFLNSEKTFTCFVSQPGYGKSIMLSHALEKLFVKEDAPFHEAALWFIDTNVLKDIASTGLTFESWISNEVGNGAGHELFDKLEAQQGGQPKPVVIVLDALDEVMFKRGQLSYLFNKIVDFICANGDKPWIKLILSMRSASWLSFYKRILDSAFMRSKWFGGSHYKHSLISNVPPLTEKEIAQILANIDPDFKGIEEVNHKLRLQFSYPFYIQLYYQLGVGKTGFDYHRDLTFYELVSDFVHRKIVLSDNNTEKMLLIRKFIHLTGYGKNGSSLTKDKFLSQLSPFTVAYKDLLQDGVFIEELQPDYSNQICFSHSHLFEYFLSIEILERFDMVIGNEMLEFIFTQYQSSSLRLQLLQWTIRHTVIQKDLRPLIQIMKMELGRDEKSYIQLFISETIRFKLKHKPEMAQKMKNTGIHSTILLELIHFDFIDPLYMDIVRSFAVLAEDDKDRYAYASILGCCATVKLDKAEIKLQIEELKRLDYKIKWPLDPLYYLEFIDSLINNQPLKEDAREGIKAFTENPGQYISPNGSDPTAEQAAAYIMMVFANSLSGNADSIGDLLAAIHQIHPKVFYHHHSGFSQYLLSLLSNVFAKTQRLHDTEKVLRILDEMTVRTPLGLAKYSEDMAMVAKSIQSRNKGDFKNFIKYSEESIDSFNAGGVIFNQVFVYRRLIEFYESSGDIMAAEDLKEKLTFLLEDRDISLKVIENDLDGPISTAISGRR